MPTDPDSLFPDAGPDAREWKRVIFETVHQLRAPVESPVQSSVHLLMRVWRMLSEAWSYRYGQWGKDRPHWTLVLDVVLLGLCIYAGVELSSYTALGIRVRQFFLPSYQDLHAEEWSAFLEEVRTRNAASELHDTYTRPFTLGALTSFEQIYGAAFLSFLRISIVFLLYLLVAYVVWFIWKHFKFVLNAFIGAIVTFVSFVVRLAYYVVRQMVGRFLRKFLPKAKAPNPVAFFRSWRKKYVDSWVDAKILQYQLRFVHMRERTLERWRYRLLTAPARALEAWYHRFRRVHLELTYYEFLQLVVALYPLYAKHPETQKYIEKNGKDAGDARFFTILSKAIHWSKREGKGKIADTVVATEAHGAARMPSTPSWVPLLLGVFLCFVLLLLGILLCLHHTPRFRALALSTHPT